MTNPIVGKAMSLCAQYARWADSEDKERPGMWLETEKRLRLASIQEQIAALLNPRSKLNSAFRRPHYIR